MSLWLRILAPVLLATSAIVTAAEPANPLDAWRQRHPEIRVAPDPDFAPIDALDSGGQHTGLAADYLRVIGERTGLKFRIVPVKSRLQAQQALRERRVDMLSSAFATALPGDYAVFSAPYLRLPCAAFVHKDAQIQRLEQLDGRRIAVTQDHICRESLASLLPKASLQVYVYPTTTKALTALSQAKADALVGDLVTAQAGATRAGIRDSLNIIGQIGSDEALSFAVRNDWPELKQILDTALDQIDVGDETRLRQRWLKDLLPDNTDGMAPAAAAEPLPAGLAATIKAARTALTDSKVLDAEATATARKALDAASTDDAQADALLAEWRGMRALAATAVSETDALDQRLSSDETASLLAWRANLSERASVEQLETQRANERAALTDAQANVASLQASVAQQHERPQQIQKELKLAQTDAETARQPEPAGAEVPANAGEALKLRRLAALRLAQVKIAKLEEELRSFEPRVRLEAARLRERQREVTERQHKVDALQNLILDRTSAVAASLNARLQQEASDLTQLAPVLREPARLNALFGEELTHNVARLAEVRAQKDEYARLRRDTAQALKNTKDRVDIGGVSEAVGLILLAERRKLQSVTLLKRKLAALQTELAQTKIRLIDLREAVSSLDDPSIRVAAELKRMPQAAADPAIRQGLYRLFATRAEVLPQLSLAQTRLADALADTVQELEGLSKDSAELQTLLGTYLLWTPSHAPVDRKLPMELASGLIDMVQPGRWWDAVTLAARLVVAKPIAALLGCATLIALWLVRRRVPAALEAISQPMRRIRSDRYRLSGRALALSLVASLVLPALVWMLSRLLQRAAETGYPFSDALGLALGDLVVPLIALSFMRWLTADKGLAATHFRWAQDRRQSLDLLRRWMSSVYLPVQFFLSLYFYYGEQLANAAVSRIVFASACGLLAWLSWRTLGPGALWAQRSGQNEPLRLRQLLRATLAATAVGLAVLALTGYFLTAVTVAARLVESGIAFLAIAVLNGMALRWLSLGERRLALKRMEEKRGAEVTRDETELEARPEFAAEAEEISLASINQQTRRLLRALTAVVLVGALLWVWSDVTPALAYLGDITAWQTSYISGGETIKVVVTLRSLLFAAVALVLTWIATRNIPGLLEIGVLRRLEVDAPTRYAITAVSRYALAIVGSVFGLSLLGLRWGQLQWMAAALTVGLGFGLQEIFANFVSGLIVLFERPIRVGDVIAIRGIEGTVTRIRTRATTIVDWDNKEVVIPNKTFITEQLTNWTLSDAVTRVVLKLGVAYTSDPDQVRALLLELARAHPKVLKEPGPNCWCVALGQSTLDFELRIFVADVMERNPVRNDLHAAILREFRARGIEIAFPQMEVLLRETGAARTSPEPR